jgi:hypothetical protein
MRFVSKETFRTAASGTQYVSEGGSTGAPVGRFESVSWSIEHPAATTTVYTVQVSNMDGDDQLSGYDDWHDYSGIAPVSKAAAEDFSINFIDCPYARVRLKAVTSGGSGVIVARQTTKGPY